MFEVGKKVICVESASNKEGKAIKKGNVYVVDGIMKLCCGNGIMLDVGFENRYGTSRCPVCSKIRPSNAIWFASVYFAPYDDSLSETTVEELLYQLTS